MRDPNQSPIAVDLSAREFEALERYAQAHGLTVDEAATELAKSETARRIGPSMQIDARVLPFQRRRPFP